MTTQHQVRRSRPIWRLAALAGVFAALATAGPVAEADAATPWWTLEPSAGEFAFGGWVIGDVFNGGTTSVVSTAPAQGNTIGSP